MSGDMPDTPEAGGRLREAQVAQRRASDPAATVWVAASAGTGKTKVLTDRVLSLMLAGTPPARVLCLTFTKAAAAEMANRLASRLAGWATAEEAWLDDALHDLTGRRPDDALRRRARELFALVLDAPGGMKIQTLHAFCQSVLARFPLEAGVPPNFQVLDERSSSEMMSAAREEVLALAGGVADDAETATLADALGEVTARAGEAVFDELLGELIRQRGRLHRLLRDAGGAAGLVARVHQALGVTPGTGAEAVLLAACGDEAIDPLGLNLAESALRQGSKAEAAKADTLRAWLDSQPERRAAGFAAYEKLFLTGEGEIRKTLLTKGAAQVVGAIEVMQAEAERLQGVRARMNAAAVARATGGLLTLGAAIMQAYERHKRRRALLDYDDLVLLTRDLLRGERMAPWVLFKLDGGVDHVLIDEAQDTNPEQWEVVDALTAEFFAGEGAAEARGRLPRTVFAVGDAKQSIYAFQRADPRAFARMRAHFAEKAREARRRWVPLDLQVSFRSTDAVLAAVDAVFARPEAQDGVLFGERAIEHRAVRAGQAGLVELWPTVDPEDAGEPAAWTPPTQTEGGARPRQRLARLIASRIARWTLGADPESTLESRGRRIRAGDILILVRRRNEFVEELVRELKQRDVPVAGVDRMVLSDQLAVMDLVALGRFLLLPEDDLTLACVLKGPLIGLSEARLFELAHGRDGRLWGALRDRAGENADFERAWTRLADLLARADFVPPYELYAELLGPGRGRAAIVARLGKEANDPIDEFLALALAYEREHVPSLEGFLHWLEAGRQEVKRDAEHGGDAVRVMTVHGAKGLQAPVVILPDTTQAPTQNDRLLWDDAAGLAIWTPRRELREAVGARLHAAARAEQEREYRRLLYVAMTRAEDRLYVCGWHTRRSGQDHCWYETIRRGLADVAAPAAFDFTAEIADGWRGDGLRLHTPQRVGARDDGVAAATGPEPVALPDWALAAPRPEPAPPRPLAPSRAPAAEPAVRSPLADDDGAAFQRGRLIHRLLQTLPDLPAEARRAAARRFLASPVHGLDEARRAAILEETLAVLEHPDFAPLFGPGSAAEVPVVGLLDGAAGPEAVSGQIDRLLVRDDRVVIVDYKTNRPPPATPAEVPEVYRRQLAAYRRLLARIYPDRRIETWLLWTDAARMMQISDAPGCKALA